MVIETGSYKIVIVLINEKYYLGLGNTADYHKNILIKLLKKENIQFELSNNMPKPSGNNYEVVGMGGMLVASNIIFANGFSTDYGINLKDKEDEIRNFLESIFPDRKIVINN